jgi:hypothetical protein
MKEKISISLIVFNQEYIDNFFKFSFNSIINNIEKFKNFEILLLITTENKYQNLFKEKFKILKNNSLKIIFDNKILKQYNNKFSYSILTKIQAAHSLKAKQENSNFIYYTYADMIYNNNCFINSFNALKNSKKSVCLTFALLLKNSDLFFQFYEKLVKEKDYINFLIEKPNIIDKFHQSFSIENINTNKSFIYEIHSDNLSIKALHTHPICIQLTNIKYETIIQLQNKNIISLDNGFLECLDINNEEIYVEEDFNKASVFSVDNNEINRTFADFKKYCKLNTKIINSLNYVFFANTFKKSDEKHQFVFENFTIRANYNQSENFKLFCKNNMKNEKLIYEHFIIIMENMRIEMKLNKYIFITYAILPFSFIFISTKIFFAVYGILTKSKFFKKLNLHNKYTKEDIKRKFRFVSIFTKSKFVWHYYFIFNLIRIYPFLIIKYLFKHNEKT